MKVAIYGFGAIGRMVAESAIKKGFEVVGAVDINPELHGRNLTEFGLKTDGSITSSLEDLPGVQDVDVVFLTTGSFLSEVFPQLRECIKYGLNIVSSCETLSYPEYRYPDLAKKIHSMAVESGVTVVAAGVNPGFMLDFLPAILSATSVEVKRIRAIRSADALKRRESFQKKVGIGLSEEEVRKKLGKEITGHVGYAESVYLLADALNFNLDDVKEGQEIVTDDSGKVLGLKGFGLGVLRSEEVIRVEFHAFAGAKEYEEVEIVGDNPVVWRSTGTKGDIATANILVNLAKTVVNAEPGVKKVTDFIPFR
jgi:4-hydroxy-tetrahydrodipicolinate reductase